MRYQAPGQFRTVEAFREHWLALAPDLACDRELSGAAGPLGKPKEVLGRVLDQRFAVHPMEGWDGTADGQPGPLTLRRWRRFGQSGARLIWGGEAFAVQEDGRANPHQLFLNPQADPARGLTALREELRAGHREVGEDPDRMLVGLQLTHSGRWARPFGEAAPRIPAHHPVLDARVGLGDSAPLLTDGELEAIGERFVAAARLAAEVGFDFVDVKCCHGYLLNELLGARHRPGPYGGSFEHRTRLFRRIVEGIQAACPGLGVGVRVSLGEVFPYSMHPDTGVGEPAGWERHRPYEHGFGVSADDPREVDHEEPLRFLALARDLGIRLVNGSLGSPYYCPHLLRPAAYPPSDGYLPPEDPLLGVARHLRAIRRVREALPELVLVGSGYTYLQEYLPHVAQAEVRAGHVDFVGLGRMVLTYPELPRDVLADRSLDRRRLCRTFSDCTTGPRHGMVSGCYPLDPHYQALPEAARVREIRNQMPR